MIQVGNGQLQRKDDMWPPDVAPTPSPPLTEARPSSSHVNARGPSPVPTSTPSPSSVDARRLSPVPTPTPSPSPPVGNMPTNEDAINLAMEDPPLNDRPMVTLINGAFHPSKVTAKAVTLSIRQQFEELGRSVYVDEIFQQTHLQKDTGQFVDDRSRRTHEEFEARLSQARSDAASSVAARPKHKGCLYGTGDLAHTYKCENDSFMQHTQGSSSRAEDVAEINRLREELR
ncbi:hypothetical protein GmHk_17G049013 [Glycine max]|nr:hypothetical protein GmHk_17G049013 [Glycine max]